jgi:Zinc-finger of RNA-polymerase I-specific TFIIB, Rrn7
MEIDDLTHRITGEVCGVDNCTSDVWTRNGDGTYSCQNGHVRAARAGEDDDAASEQEFARTVVGTTTTRKREREKREALGTPSSSHIRVDRLTGASFSI